MPRIHPKSDELIQAQIATYAAEDLGHSDFNSRHLLNNLGDLAVSGVKDVTRTVNSVENQHDWETGLPVEIPIGTVLPVASKDDYVGFLRRVGGANYDPIKGRAEMLEAYKQFQPAIAALKEDIQMNKDPMTHPNFLGNGASSLVFYIEKDGKRYATRIPRTEDLRAPSMIDSHLAGAVLSKGMPHVEQIIAASYTDGVTIAEIMPGVEIGDLSVQEIKDISDEQLKEFIKTARQTYKNGIEIDPKPSNFFYDVKNGFGVVDVHSSKIIKTTKDQTLGDQVGWLSVAIANAGLYGKPSTYETETKPEQFARKLNFYEVQLEVINRYRAIVVKELSSEDLEDALHYIDERIDEKQRLIDTYSDPKWVTERIAKVEAAKKRQAKAAQKITKSSDGYSGIEAELI